MFKPTSSINRPVLILGLVSLFTDIASEMLYPIMPMYLTGILGVSMLELGLLEGAAEALASLFKAFFGSLSDAWDRRKPFVILGYTLSALSKPVPGIWQAVPGVVVSRLSDRLGKAIRTAPRDALLAAYSPKDKQGAVFGFHRAMDTMGAAVGPLIALVYIHFYKDDYTTLFLLAFLPSALAIFLTFVVKESSRRESAAGEKIILARQFEVFSSSSVMRKLLLAVTLFSMVNSSDVFLIMRAREQGYSDSAAIGAYVLYNLLYAAFAFPLGGLSDKFGKRFTLRFGFSAYVLSYLLFAWVPVSSMLVLGFGIYALYAASTQSIIKAWISELTPEHLRASAFGLLTMLMGLGMLLSSVIAGWLWDNVGPQAAFYFAACGALLSIFLLPKYNKPVR